ncbi:hypothetical protein HK099_004009, partial [Clydaea vesicula]
MFSLAKISIFILSVTATSWESATAKAKDVIKDLSNQEKVTLVSGIGWGQPNIWSGSQSNLCVGNIAKVSKINGFEGLCLQDGPSGVRFQNNQTASSFGASINVASTWDRELMHAHGKAQGQEFRDKGVNIALAPMMNIGRVAAGGRNWEGYGEDPFLASVSAAEVVKGLQSTGVMANAKHFLGNEQEHFRDAPGGWSKIDERAIHEIYLPPFKACIEAGVVSVMCAYNRLLTEDGELNFACEHKRALDGLLKGELNFQGFVMSDWWSTHDHILAANNGLDMMMAGEATNPFADKNSDLAWSHNLLKAVENGLVAQSRLDDMATRVLAAWYKVGQDKGFPKTNFDSWNNDRTDDKKSDQLINVRSNHADIIRRVGADSIVLLKNTDNLLPLKVNNKIISVIGDNSRPPKENNPNQFPDRSGVDGHCAIGWGSGTTNFPYLVSPLEALTSKANGTHTKFQYYSSTEKDYATIKDSDTALVFVYANSGEGYTGMNSTVNGPFVQGDRNDLFLFDYGDDLVKKIAEINKNVVVIITAPGPVDMSAWINHPNVKSVLFALYPGQESGNSIYDVLSGRINPSGKLPFTIAKENDYCCKVQFEAPGHVEYAESHLVGYRWFDSNKIAPQFPFGHGLSYTSFEYSNLAVSFNENGSGKITLDLKNSGNRLGREVVQVYVGLPEVTKSAPLNLKAFEKVRLSEQETKKVEFTLSQQDLSFWNVKSKSWELAKGTYQIFVGSS